MGIKNYLKQVFMLKVIKAALSQEKAPTLDFNLNGAMGKQRGIGGGIGCSKSHLASNS